MSIFDVGFPLRTESMYRFNFGYPSSNQGNFFFKVQLPDSFRAGDRWQDHNSSFHNGRFLSSYAVGEMTWMDCYAYDVIWNDSSTYLSSTGIVVFAKNIGPVYMRFVRNSDPYVGQAVTFTQIESRQFMQHTIHGQVVDGGQPVANVCVQLGNGDWGSRSVTDANGNFAVSAYGPDVVLYADYDQNEDYTLDFTSKHTEFSVHNVTQDIYGVTIELTN